MCHILHIVILIYLVICGTLRAYTRFKCNIWHIMKIVEKNSDGAILDELGNRIAQYRLHRNLSQAELAKEAGMSLRTLVRIEQGYPSQMPNIIRLLRVLGLLENIETLIPQLPDSPIQQLKMAGKQRKRASSRSSLPKDSEPWVWGEE